MTNTTNLNLQKIEDTDYAGNFPTIYNNNLDLIDSAISEHSANISNLQQSIASKQNVLTAGDNITIENDVISASGGGGGGSTSLGYAFTQPSGGSQLTINLTFYEAISVSSFTTKVFLYKMSSLTSVTEIGLKTASFTRNGGTDTNPVYTATTITGLSSGVWFVSIPVVLDRFIPSLGMYKATDAP